MINVNSILELQKNCVINWHDKLVLSMEQPPSKFIEENHQYNFLLWHEEDVARVKDIELIKIVEAKRNIDKYNQLRNNAIEKIDEWILTFLGASNDPFLTMHSETPGMMIDRLSIMSLKRYHMFIETMRQDASEEHRAKCSYKVSILDEQINDLANCLRMVLHQLQEGKLKFKVYRQLKMYNDQNLNPQLYTRLQSK